MLSGLISGLLVGWVLTIFGFDEILLGFTKEMFNMSLSINTYYMLFAMLGILAEILD